MISVAMIARNEELRLPRALESLKKQPAITQIVVLDTGSTDKTVEIAKSFGCEVIENETIFYMTAEETLDGLPRIDFSACRNRSVTYCTGKWLFCLDADEWVEGDVQALVDLAIERDRNAVAIWIHSFQGDSQRPSEQFVQPRLVRNDGSVKWIYPIHNQRQGMQDPVPVSDGALIWSDYSGAGRIEAKHARTKPMLLKLYKENPMDPHGPWFLLRMAEGVGAWDEVEKWADALFGILDPKDMRWAQTAMSLIMAYTRQDEPGKTSKALSRLLHQHPHHPDGRFTMLVAAFKAWEESLTQGASYFGVGQQCLPFISNKSHIAALLGLHP
jgi:glycosyltransferase involved in cell wall biosynthesis